MQSHTNHQLGAPSNMTSEISLSSQQPFAQYIADALSRGDLLCGSSIAEIDSSSSSPNVSDFHLFEHDEQVMNQILDIVMNQYTQEKKAVIDPLAAAQHIITFKLRPAVLNEPKLDDAHYDQADNAEQVDDDHDSKDQCVLDDCHNMHQYPTPIQSKGVTTYVLKDTNPFRQRQPGDYIYKQRECKFRHFVVDLERNIYYTHAVTSITVPYGVIKHRQRRHLLHRAADLYPAIDNSIQFIYTSVMGMIYFDAVVINNNGDKLSKRIMTISDLVSFVSACFGLPSQSQNLHKLKDKADVKIQTDWDYIKYIAATYGKLVSDSFMKLLLDAVTNLNSNDKPPSQPSLYGIIESPSSSHIQQKEIYALLEMIGISSDGFDIDFGDQSVNEEDKEEEDMKPNQNEVNNDNPDAHDENDHDIDTILAMLDEMHAQNEIILNRLNQWQCVQKQEEPDPYMPYDFPEDDQVMKNE